MGTESFILLGGEDTSQRLSCVTAASAAISLHRVMTAGLLRMVHGEAKATRSCPTLCSLMVHGEAKATRSCPTLCSLMDCSLPGSSVHSVFQARILEWVTIPFSRGSSQPRDQTCFSCTSCIAGRFFTNEPPGKSPGVKVIQSSPTLCDPKDCIVHGILQARILEWVVFPFCRGSSQPRDRT